MASRSPPKARPRASTNWTATPSRCVGGRPRARRSPAERQRGRSSCGRPCFDRFSTTTSSCSSSNGGSRKSEAAGRCLVPKARRTSRCSRPRGHDWFLGVRSSPMPPRLLSGVVRPTNRVSPMTTANVVPLRQRLVEYSQSRITEAALWRALFTHKDWLVPVTELTSHYRPSAGGEYTLPGDGYLFDQDLTSHPQHLFLFTDPEPAFLAKSKGIPLGMFSSGMAGVENNRPSRR